MRWRFWGDRPWGRAALWLAVLIPMFFGTYIAALEVTATRAHVPTIVFAWERHVPFLAWTVVPYWSIDFFYGLSLFLCRTPAELRTHALRVVTAQAVAIPIFLLFPLRLTSTIPVDTGIWAPFYAALGDLVGRPYNLAPSLHIALLVILWVRYVRHVPWPWQVLVHVWASLIGVSVLTAYQHHFFDIPTGAMLGFFCLWAWPDGDRSPLAGLSVARDGRRLALAAAYAAGGVALAVVAFGGGGAWLWLLWPSQSLLLVASAYAAVGERLFGKGVDGRTSLAVWALLLPYLALARASAWLLARNVPDSDVAAGVRVGRMPLRAPTVPVVDLTAELPAPLGATAWRCLPALDLVPPPPDRLCEAARAIEAHVERGEGVLVCCALGFSRAPAAVATWLAASGRAPDVDAALARVRAARPAVVLGPGHRGSVAEAVRRLREGRP